MDSRYAQEVSKYGKKDAIVAICVYVFLMVTLFAQGAIRGVFVDNWTPLQSDMFSMIPAIIFVGIVFVVIRKQGLSSIGIHKAKLWPALRLGLLMSIIPLTFLHGLLPGLLHGSQFQNIGYMMYLLLFTFVLAAHEDVLFVGYFQTRIHGIIKNSRLALIVVAIMFGLVHLPFSLGEHGIGFLGIVSIIWVVWTGIMHCIYVFVFKRHFSLIPVMILHTAMNFAPRLWYDGEHGYMDWSLVSFAVLLLVVGVMILHSRHRAKKVSTGG